MRIRAIGQTELTLRRTTIGAGFVVLYFALAIVALPHNGAWHPLHPWNAAVAVSFALVTRFGLIWLPVAFACALVSILVLDPRISLAAALWMAMAEASACGLAAGVMTSQGATKLFRVRPVVTFFAAVIMTAGVVSIADATVVMVGSGSDWAQALDAGGRRLLATVAALVLVSPALITHLGLRHWPPRRPSISIETLLQIIALSVILWEVFGRFDNKEIHFFYLLFLPLGWIATRHGQSGVTIALAVAYIAPLASDWFVFHRDQAVIELQVRLIVWAATSLLLGAMVSERRLLKARMLVRQTELAHVQRLNIGWEMASALAHEINQPLTAAMNYTQASLRLLSAPSPDLQRAAGAMKKSLDQIERVGQIIHGLRDFMNKSELRMARTDMAETIDDAVRLVTAEANEAGVTLDLVDVTSFPAVMADKTQVVQIVVNLLRNAIQALAATGTTSGLVFVSGAAKDGFVTVTVADNGPGIDPDIRARLFEPFVTSKASGMGLGLSISKSIAEAHHGQLKVESRASGGTAFHIVLPFAEKEMRDA